MTLGWGGFVDSITEKQTMLSVLENVKTSLENKGNYIPVNELQAIQTEDRDFKHLYSKKPFPVSELIKIIDALIQMLEGTWTLTMAITNKIALSY